MSALQAVGSLEDLLRRAAPGAVVSPGGESRAVDGLRPSLVVSPSEQAEVAAVLAVIVFDIRVRNFGRVFLNMLARHTGQPLEKVTADTERDRFMGPDEAQDYGIIDAVYNLQGSSLIAAAHDAGLSGGEGSSVTEPAEAAAPEAEQQQKKSKS